MFLAWLLFALSQPAFASGDCDVPLDESELISQIESAEASLEAAAKLKSSALRCVQFDVDAKLAAHLHSAIGLAAWARQEPQQALAAFAAARAADPDHRLPRHLTDAHPALARDYLAVASTSEPQPVWARGVLLSFDGQSADRPADLPTVLQARVDGQIVLTSYLLANQPLPVLDVLPPPTPPPVRRSSRRPLLYAAAVTGALTLGLAGASTLTTGGYERQISSQSRQKQRDRAWTLVGATLGAGGTTLGLGVFALSSRKR